MQVDITNLIVGDSFPISFSTDLFIPSDYNLTVNSVSVNINGNLTKQGSFFILDALLESVLYFSCDTCLSPVTYELSVPMNERFGNSADDNDDIDIWQFIGKVIDLDEAIYTNLLLNIPMKVVCSNDCKGLCFKCGHNLNEGDCTCDKTHRDPRFESLYSLFNDEEV
jgi:uncharacterized protein